MCPPAKPLGRAYPNTDLEPYETMLMTKNDPVNHPDHYKNGGIETIDVIEAKLSPQEFQGYCIGNALKYLTRRNYKGKPREDERKAHWYLSRALACLDGSGQQNPPAAAVALERIKNGEVEEPLITDYPGHPPKRHRVSGDTLLPPVVAMECIQTGCLESRRPARLYCEDHRLSTGKSGEQGGPDGK